MLRPLDDIPLNDVSRPGQYCTVDHIQTPYVTYMVGSVLSTSANYNFKKYVVFNAKT